MAIRKHMMVGLIITTATGSHADDLCARLQSIEWTAPPKPNESGRRWIEMHWRGSWLDVDRGWSLACQSSGEPESKALCRWLPDHTSFEFAKVLPMRILECYGYRFPHPYPSWDSWKAGIRVGGNGRSGLLEINFADLKGEEGAVRFSVFAPMHDETTDALSTLAAMPPLHPPSRADVQKAAPDK